KELILHQMARKLLADAANVRKSPNGPISGLTAEINRILQTVAALIKKKVEDAVGKQDLVDTNELDVSLMVCDGVGNVPLLKSVGCVGNNATDIWSSELEVGDGNAGRALKKSMARSYDRSISGQTRQTYVPNPNFPHHEILFSMPLIGAPDESG